MFKVIMTCTIDGYSEIYDGFSKKGEAETFVKNSKQMDMDCEKTSWFLYSIEEY